VLVELRGLEPLTPSMRTAIEPHCGLRARSGILGNVVAAQGFSVSLRVG
jgi:hypothetical protein